ncbi:uncharacterized protein LOC129696468 [Leucoraja erinacea]|uniref:uncharacterized protein LOC129696468 n=1 Tax=Leucoraja erinaceus TaxID=7782 RepID=UPI0024539F2B|nr:uncharacterized protein LOC129696468 [Leucoraja erinacea]
MGAGPGHLGAAVTPGAGRLRYVGGAWAGMSWGRGLGGNVMGRGLGGKVMGTGRDAMGAGPGRDGAPWGQGLCVTGRHVGGAWALRRGGDARGGACTSWGRGLGGIVMGAGTGRDGTPWGRGLGVTGRNGGGAWAGRAGVAVMSGTGPLPAEIGAVGSGSSSILVATSRSGGGW